MKEVVIVDGEARHCVREGGRGKGWHFARAGSITTIRLAVTNERTPHHLALGRVTH